MDTDPKRASEDSELAICLNVLASTSSGMIISAARPEQAASRPSQKHRTPQQPSHPRYWQNPNLVDQLPTPKLKALGSPKPEPRAYGL